MDKKQSIFFLNSNNNDSWLCIGSSDELVYFDKINWTIVDDFLTKYNKDYVVSIIGYDAKNSIENLSSKNTDYLNTPELALIVPETVYHIRENVADLVFGPSRTDILLKIMEEPSNQTLNFELKPKLSKVDYIEKFNIVKQRIQHGDIYEINYCQPMEAFSINPFDYLDVYKRVNNNTNAPFSVFVNWKNWKMIGASPERYIKRVGHMMISQPIKGTRRRGVSEEEDEKLKAELQHDVKERAENVMIVDLVRNDLAKVAIPGTVKVDELCGIYTFDTVHQMISTISCTLKEDVSFSDIIKASFPMGSMTGAPKISAMEIIEELEDFKRGWYSGSVGLIQPKGNFDLNVVIRSIIFNEETGYICCPVGGAITDLADAESEYLECQIKVERILSGLNE